MDTLSPMPSRVVPRPALYRRTLGWLFTAMLVVFSMPLAAAQAQETEFDSGHVDVFYVTAPDGQLSLSMKEDITGSEVERPGDDVVLRVNENAWSDATESVDAIGTPTYSLPQTQKSDIIWPGWDTQKAQQAGYKDVDLNFVDVSGPGAVYIFETTGFGDIESVTDSGDLELRSGEVINQPYPAHRHVNWAFSEPGTYTMTVQASSNGDTSNKVTYTWSVGDGEAAGEEDGEYVEDEDFDDVEGESDSTDSDAESDGHSASAGSLSSAGGALGGANASGNRAASGNHSSGAKSSGKPGREKSRKHVRRGHKSHSGAQEDGSDVALQSAGDDFVETPNYLPWGLGLLGVGMLMLGLGVMRWVLAKVQD